MGRIGGEATIEPGPQIANGILRVRLVDVSRADAPSVVVSESQIDAVRVETGGEHIPFTLEVPELDPRSTYSLEAHLDANGSGETTVGDYRTMEHFPVDTSDRFFSIRMRPVG